MAKVLLILNDPPYGTERSYNALRLAGSLAKHESEQVRVFLIREGAACACAHQKVPQGHHNIEVMLNTVATHGMEIGVCTSCMDARCIADSELVETTHRSSLEELTTWTREADKALVF